MRDTAIIDSYGGSEGWKFDTTGYFRLQRASKRWWLVDPEGNGFITVGVNHADETNLKYPHNSGIWKRKYGSRGRWIRDGLVKDLRDWGFNTIGWTGEHVSGDWGATLDWFGDPIDLGHSAGWSAADFEAANMPYCLQLRVAEIEDWNGQPSFPDVYSQRFDEHCEYLARSVCFDHAQSRNLLGYFLVDIPAWLSHASGEDFPALKGLSESARDEKLHEVAGKYYETIAKHIRTYDPNHLILGDRYNGDKGIPAPVLDAMQPFVDVLSVQYFGSGGPEGYQRMQEDLARWHERTGKPVINADIGNWTPTILNPNRVSEIESQGGRAEDYVDAMNTLIDQPWFLGWHWCAYVENTARGWGIKDPWDEPYRDFIGPVKEFNKSVYEKVSAGAASGRVGRKA